MKEGSTLIKAVRFRFVNDSLREEDFYVVGNHKVRDAEAVFYQERGDMMEDGLPDKVWLDEDELEELLGLDQAIDRRR